MSDSLKTSVVISTYNGERYIVQQLNSINDQSQKADEVIIVDDCSTDNTLETVKKYIEENGLDWTLRRNGANKGWQKNFMDAINSASGELVFISDQDDVWDKEKINVMSRVMKDNTHIDVLVSGYKEFTEDIKSDDNVNSDDETEGEESSCKSSDKSSGKYSGKIRKINLSKRFFTVDYPGCTYCVRKSFFDKIKGYWKPGFPHDALLWRFAIFSDSLFLCEDVLFNWRKHTDSEFAKETNRKKKLADRIEWVDYASQFTAGLYRYIKNNSSLRDRRNKVHLLHKYKEWLNLRKKFFKEKNPVYGIMLIKYICYYRDFKQYLGDWYTVYIKR